MRHLDLFTGIGGFHLAAEWAGFQTVGFSEIEPYCCRLLAEKWPEIPNYGDIRTADFSGLPGRITVLSAGVPCQPASLAGKRRGAGDDRWLWPAVLDVVGTVEPAWCLLENPPGILILDEFGGVLLRMESLGYAVRMFSVPANAVGAKHRRQRVFIVANRTCELLNGSRDARPGRRDESADGGKALADTSCAGMRQSRGSCKNESVNGTQDDNQPVGSGEALADAKLHGTSQRRGTRESETDRRLLESERPFPRLTEPPLCRRADGVQNRSHRLKALGNAVVPQQAYPFFAAIAQVERRL